MTIDEAKRLLTFARDLRFADLRGTTLPEIDLSTCDLTEGKFGEMNASGADFSQTTLRGASFYDADLTHADFTDANLSDADMDYVTITGAMFHRATMTRTHLPEKPGIKAQILKSILTGSKVG